MIMTEHFSNSKIIDVIKKMNTVNVSSSQAELRAETPYLDSVYYSQVGVIRDVVNMISNYYTAAVTQAPGHAYRPRVVLLGHYNTEIDR